MPYINLTKEMKDFYNENYEAFKKLTEDTEDKQNRKIFHVMG